MADIATWSHRPEKHSERTEVIGFLVANDVEHRNPLVQAQFDVGYRAAEARYLADRAANDAATAKAAWVGDQLGAANDAFDAAFKRWLRFAEAAAGADLSKRLSPVLGDRSPSRFLLASVPEKIEGFKTLRANITQFPELVGDAAALADLDAAAAALGQARLDNDGALDARARTVRALKDATADFDRQYGLVVKIVLATDPAGLGADLPRFRRDKAAGTGPADLPPAAK
jgi:hypothetical protein